jgi:hypothetical protein
MGLADRGGIGSQIVEQSDGKELVCAGDRSP